MLSTTEKNPCEIAFITLREITVTCCSCYCVLFISPVPKLVHKITQKKFTQIFPKERKEEGREEELMDPGAQMSLLSSQEMVMMMMIMMMTEERRQRRRGDNDNVGADSSLQTQRLTAGKDLLKSPGPYNSYDLHKDPKT